MGLLDSFVSAIGNYITGRETNKTNKEIAEDTNEQQYKMFQEQMGYQTAERLATQEYNSPKNQRLLYEQAGINPYAVLGTMKPETVAQSAPAAPNQHLPQVVPNSLIGQTLGATAESIKSQLENDSLALDNDSKRIDLMFKTREKLLGIEEKIVDISHKKNLTEQDKVQLSILENQRDSLKEDLDILRSSKQDLILQNKLHTKQMRLDNKARKLANQYNEWKADFEKQRGEKELNLLEKQVQEVLSQIALNNSLSAEAAARRVLVNAEKEGVHLDNQQKKYLRGHVLKMARLEEEGYEANNAYTRYNTGINSRDILGAGADAGKIGLGFLLGRYGVGKSKAIKGFAK